MYLTTHDAKRILGMTPRRADQAVVRLATGDCQIGQRPTDAVG